MQLDHFLSSVKPSESETPSTRETEMTDVPMENQESEETPINLYLKKSYNQLLKLAEESDEENEDVDYIKKYHEKHFKVFKQ